MKILGLNMGYSQPGDATPVGLRHPLSDGSAALLEEGKLVFAGIEERHTRQRYQGGFGNAVCAFWGCDSGAAGESVDLIAISSCCGPRWPADQRTAVEIEHSLPPGLCASSSTGIPRILVVDHHDSHAALGFALSGAKRALVAVIDGFGNLIEPAGWSPDQWWRGRFHRHSYYLAEATEGGFSLTTVARDAQGKDDVGLGEAYRAITHFCGWKSYQHAGSAMALAAFGDPGLYADVPFIRCVADEIRCSFENDHPNPADVVERILRQFAAPVTALNGRTATPADSTHCAVVRAVQEQLTEAICSRLISLAARLAVDTIVVAGGVALNCLAMGQLQHRFGGRVFVPPAPSDTGQALGNAIWAHSCSASPCFNPAHPSLDLREAPFWGVPPEGLDKALRRLRSHPSLQITTGISQGDQFAQAAQSLASGELVAICMGRAEYGPRALGRRSILFDPRRADAPTIVNRFKQREAYRPFAPAILEENLGDFFAWPVHSPFMSFAVPIRPEACARTPGIVHADGTARVQTLHADSTSPLRPILEQFATITGIPLLLNTSFNRKGEPMIETPCQAVEAFLHSTIDTLLLDGITIKRTGKP